MVKYLKIFAQLVHILFHLRYKDIPPASLKTLLCCIVKRENRYIRDYVKWYKDKGFTGIVIYDNNDPDGERLDEVLSDYLDEGFVRVVDFRGRKVCQLDSYRDCIFKYAPDYDWVAFFDADEFLDFTEQMTIGQYLLQPIFRKFDMIHINWMCYGSEGKIKYDGQAVHQRFTHPLCGEDSRPESYALNNHIKTIIRGRSRGRYVCWWSTPHTPDPCILRCCNAVGSPCTPNSPFNLPDYSRAFLRHYTTKSLEEFVAKVKRGYPDAQVYGAPFLKKMANYWYTYNPDSKISRKDLLQMFNEDD